MAAAVIVVGGRSAAASAQSEQCWRSNEQSAVVIASRVLGSCVHTTAYMGRLAAQYCMPRVATCMQPTLVLQSHAYTARAECYTPFAGIPAALADILEAF